MTYGVHLEWGVSGAGQLSSEVGVAVVVDVLSFTTTLGVACERGITVLPYRYADDTAAAFAEMNGAVLALPRRQSSPGTITLSPGSIRRSAEPPDRLVLPSPNGSTISQLLSDAGLTVVAASLRNAAAVSAFVHERHPRDVVAVIAGGERWDDGSLRPAVEDFWGAGAVLDALVSRGRSDLTPEALAAVYAWRGVSTTASDDLAGTVSGRELESIGFGADVRVAGEIGSSTVVPVMDGAVYRSAR